jgi:hypothetical protein
LAGLLSQLTGNLTHHVKISVQFIQVLESVRLQPDDVMLLFDVVFQFTKVPITNTIELLSHRFEDDVLALFKHVLASAYFCFEGQFYKQTEEVAMGSPLSPVVTIFMGDFGKKAIELATHKPLYSV